MEMIATNDWTAPFAITSAARIAGLNGTSIAGPLICRSTASARPTTRKMMTGTRSDPMNPIGSLLVPVIIFLVVGRALAVDRQIRGPAIDVPFNPAILAALVIANGAVQSLVAIISIYREGGILKRLRATPLSPVTILGAHVVVKLCFTVMSLSLLVLAGRRLFPGVLEVNIFSFTVAVLLS